MDARRAAERHCMLAKSNVDKMEAACNYAKYSGLADNEFESVTNSIDEDNELIIIEYTHVTDKLEKHKPLDPSDELTAKNAFLKSHELAVKMDKEIAAAMQRNRARDEEAKARKKGKAEESKARKKARVEEASNKPGGSNA